FGGRDPESGQPFVASELAAGGMGARPDKDGIDVIETDVSNCMNIQVESVEMNFPLRISRARLWVDSGGPGRFRGGLGPAKAIEDGVVLTPDAAAVDEVKTKECREARSPRR